MESRCAAPPRDATVADIRAIAVFQTDAWNDAYRQLVPAEYLARMTAETRAVRWGDRIRAGERRVQLVEENGGIVAVLSFGERSDDRPGPRLELMSLYVAASARGDGLGSRLLRHALGDAPAVLWVFEANERAIVFYRRHGFLPDGQRMADVDTGLPEIRLTREATGSRES